MSLKVITLIFLGLVAVITISIVVIRRKQNRRLAEARMRGIKQALREQEQYDTLRGLEGRDDYNQQETRRINRRREIKR